MTTIVGAIEAGGTKFNCARISENREILAEAQIATTTPAETLGQVLEFFGNGVENLSALGISCFGPIDLDLASATYGHITETPKSSWRNTDIVGYFKPLGIPIVFDTDVNGAAYGEFKYGAAQGLHTFVYYTIGTGIGGGGMVSGHLMHGLSHPEMGHVRIPQNQLEDPYGGCCPFHGNCFEGLASGPAIKNRWGHSAEDLSTEHPAWDLEAQYIAYAVANTICSLSPQRIILGGGVMKQEVLFPRIRQRARAILNGYLRQRDILDAVENYIVPPALGDRSAIFGAAAMALSDRKSFPTGN